MTKLVGIVNLTRDSFSDGGCFLDPKDAIAHALSLVAQGADIIDLGAESTHPDAEDVPAELEFQRLEPVLHALRERRVCVSVDTHKPEVMRRVLAAGAGYINDVSGFRDPRNVAAVRASDARLIVMHSRSRSPRAVRDACASGAILSDIVTFFERRIESLTNAGVERQRLVLDPGMGFFLSNDASVSVDVLRNFNRLRELELPVMVSVSRKSFIGSMLASPQEARVVDQRGAGTLAAELWAALHGAQLIRTHDVVALRDALTVWRAIENSP